MEDQNFESQKDKLKKDLQNDLLHIATQEQDCEQKYIKDKAEIQSSRDKLECTYIDLLFKLYQKHLGNDSGDHAAIRDLGNGSQTVEPNNPALPQQSTTPTEPCKPATPAEFAAPPDSAVARHGHLSIKNGQLVDMHQKPVRLQGMSLFWSQWMGKYYTPETINWLVKDWKVNLIRIAMAADGSCQPASQQGYLFDPTGETNKVKTVVQACVDNGVYCIIDWHCEGPSDEGKAKEFFKQMAMEYKHTPNVMFETWNEPTGQPGMQPKDYWNSVLKPYHENVVGEIRNQGAQNVCILGTPSWSSEVGVASWNQLDANRFGNVAYTVHFYAGGQGQGNFDLSKVKDALAHGAAVVCTEWGTCNNDGKGNLNLGAAQTWMDFFVRHNISSANWAVSDKDADGETASALKAGAPETGNWDPNTQLTPSGQYVRKYFRDHQEQQMAEVLMR